MRDECRIVGRVLIGIVRGRGRRRPVGADQHAIDSTNRDFNKPIIDVQREAWRRCAPWRARIEKVNANLNEDGTHGADVTDWTFDCTHPKPVLSITVPGTVSSQDRQLMLDAIVLSKFIARALGPSA